MHWRDEGVLLAVRRHGESSAIIEMFTAAHGRHAGVVRGGAGRRLSPVLQPGTQLVVDWRARLEEHLGHFTVEPLRSRAAAVMDEPAALAALNAVSALLTAYLPERDARPGLYAQTIHLLDTLGNDPDWPRVYAVWEMALLADLGFGLDLARCAATGSTEDLVYVSPRTGRAVGAAAGAPYAERMLPLPAFLRGGEGGTVAEALRMTGFFLARQVAPSHGREGPPAARARLAELLRNA